MTDPEDSNALVSQAFQKQKMLNLSCYGAWKSIVEVETTSPNNSTLQAAAIQNNNESRFICERKVDLETQSKMHSFYSKVKMCGFGQELYLLLDNKLTGKLLSYDLVVITS